jgi:hypothetical protein
MIPGVGPQLAAAADGTDPRGVLVFEYLPGDLQNAEDATQAADFTRSRLGAGGGWYREIPSAATPSRPATMSRPPRRQGCRGWRSCATPHPPNAHCWRIWAATCPTWASRFTPASASHRRVCVTAPGRKIENCEETIEMQSDAFTSDLPNRTSGRARRTIRQLPQTIHALCGALNRVCPNGIHDSGTDPSRLPRSFRRIAMQSG